MAGRKRAFNPPARRDRRQRIEDEAARAKLAMGDGQSPRSQSPAAPQCHVEVEHTGAPALSPAAAEFALDGLQADEHVRRLELAFDQRDGIGEIAAGSAVGRVEDDRGSIEQPEILVEPGNRGLDHPGGTAVPAVRAVRPDRNGVEIWACGQLTPFGLSLSKPCPFLPVLRTRTVLRQAQDERYGGA